MHTFSMSLRHLTHLVFLPAKRLRRHELFAQRGFFARLAKGPEESKETKDPKEYSKKGNEEESTAKSFSPARARASEGFRNPPANNTIGLASSAQASSLPTQKGKVRGIFRPLSFTPFPPRPPTAWSHGFGILKKRSPLPPAHASKSESPVTFPSEKEAGQSLVVVLSHRKVGSGVSRLTAGPTKKRVFLCSQGVYKT